MVRRTVSGAGSDADAHTIVVNAIAPLSARVFITPATVDAFCPICNIYTIHRFPCIVKFFLVDDGIDTDRGLTGLAVTDHQLTLSTADTGIIASIALIPVCSGSFTGSRR
jgi:hypothetical protein